MGEPTNDDIQAMLPDDNRPESHQIREITGGWVSWTFDVADEWIVQIPRRVEDVSATLKQVALLPRLADWVPFRVPVPEIIAHWQDRPVVRYRKVPGRPLQASDNPEPLAAMLHALHSFPVQRAVDLTGSAATAMAWQAGYASFYEQVQREVLPVLDDELARLVTRQYEQQLEDGFDFEPALVHRDLGAVHILIDDATGRPSGMIDFETAAVGDPAIDFVGLLITLGLNGARAVMDEHGNGVQWSQVRFYWWLGPVYDVIHGRSVGDPAIVRDGIDGLARRVTAARSAR